MSKRNKLPSNWDSSPLSRVGQIVSGSTPKTSILRYWNGELVWLTPNDLNNKQKYYDTSTRRISTAGLKSSSARLIPARSVVISSRAPVGYIGIPTIPYTTNQGCKSIIPNNSFSGEYLYYALHSCVSEMLRLGSGTTFTEISKTQLESIEVIFPTDTTEQSKIAEVLSTCDEAIEQTEAIIAKYERIKQGLMQDLLTKGIDENGNIRSEKTHKFKNSPLGRIPVEWDVTTFEGLAYINPRLRKRPDKNTEVTFLRMEDISEKGGILKRRNRKFSTVASGFTPFEENDVIFAKITPCMENGKGATSVGLLNGIGMGSTEFHVLRAKNGNSSDYIYNLTMDKSFRLKAKANMTGTAGQQRVPSEFLRRYKTPLLDLKEQFRIAAVLNSANEVISRETKHLHKLSRIKSGLMQDLLSGNVRVTPLMQKV